MADVDEAAAEEEFKQQYDLYRNGKLTKRKKKQKKGDAAGGWKKAKEADGDPAGSGDAEFEASYKQYVRRYNAEDRPYVRGEHSTQAIAGHLAVAVGRLGADAMRQIQRVPFGEAIAAAAAASSSSSSSTASTGGGVDGSADNQTALQLAQFACEHAIANSKTPPQAHQVRAMQMLLRETSQVLDWSTGSGKTLAACMSVVAALFLLDLQGLGTDKRAFFVTPKSLVDNMRACMKNVFAGVDDAWIERRCVFLTHKEFYLRYHHRERLEELTGGVLLIDECHEFRNPLGKGAFVLLRTAPRWSHVLLLSATTLYNRPSDWVVPVALVYRSSAPLPGALVDRAADCIVSLLHDRREESAAPEMKEQRAAATDILRIFQNLVQRKWDVYELDAALLARMPSTSDEVVSLPMTVDFYLQQYRKMEQTASQGDLAAFAGGRRFDGRNITVFYNGLRRLVNLYDESHSDLQTPKVEWTLRELKRRRDARLAAHEPVEQSIIISSFVNMGSMQLAPKLIAMGFRVAAIHGGMSQAERTSLVEKFNRRVVQVLLLSNVGSIGWDFKRVEFQVELDPGWNEALTQQRKGRGCRIDSHKDMPEGRRHVARRRLLLDLPPAEALPPKALTSAHSVDRHLFQLCERKQRFLDAFRQLVFRTSIALFM